MVLHTSAIVAILQGERERREFLEVIEAAESRRMSVATLVEISMVIEARYGAEGVRDLDRFIARAGIDLLAVDQEQGQIAREAFSRFGKGRHLAALDFGDCFSYALATLYAEPLLCKSNRFAHTDVALVRPPG